MPGAHWLCHPLSLTLPQAPVNFPCQSLEQEIDKHQWEVHVWTWIYLHSDRQMALGDTEIKDMHGNLKFRMSCNLEHQTTYLNSLPPLSPSGSKLLVDASAGAMVPFISTAWERGGVDKETQLSQAKWWPHPSNGMHQCSKKICVDFHDEHIFERLQSLVHGEIEQCRRCSFKGLAF